MGGDGYHFFIWESECSLMVVESGCGGSIVSLSEGLHIQVPDAMVSMVEKIWVAIDRWGIFSAV